MKNILNFLIVLITINGFSQAKDSIAEKKLEIGISVKKDFYFGENFINKSLEPQLNFEIDMLYNFENGYWVGLYYFRNSNKIKTTEYIGNINNSTLKGFGIKGKKIVTLNQNISFIPQVNFSSAVFKHSINNSNGILKKFTTNGIALGIDSAIRYKAQKDFYIEIIGSLRHLFFTNMQASTKTDLNYKSTELLSIGTRISVDF